jgi:hypothetical protein
MLILGDTKIVKVKDSLGFGIFETEDEFILTSVGVDGLLGWGKASQ